MLRVVILGVFVWLLSSCGALFSENADKEGGSSEVLAEGEQRVTLMHLRQPDPADTIDVWVEKQTAQGWELIQKGWILGNRNEFGVQALSDSTWITLQSRKNHSVGAWSPRQGGKDKSLQIILNQPSGSNWPQSRTDRTWSLDSILLAQTESLHLAFPPSWSHLRPVGVWAYQTGSFLQLMPQEDLRVMQEIPIFDPAYLSVNQPWDLDPIYLGLPTQMDSLQYLGVSVWLQSDLQLTDAYFFSLGGIGSLRVRDRYLVWKTDQSDLNLMPILPKTWYAVDFKMFQSEVEIQVDGKSLGRFPLGSDSRWMLLAGDFGHNVIVEDLRIYRKDSKSQEVLWWRMDFDRCSQDFCLAEGLWNQGLPTAEWAPNLVYGANP
jgi:hypothetical protein